MSNQSKAVAALVWGLIVFFVICWLVRKSDPPIVSDHTDDAMKEWTDRQR